MMSYETRVSRQKVTSIGQRACHFNWPISKSPIPDEMNTSYGPRIDSDGWDFHDGIDLPAAVGTPVHAMADGIVHRAGPADKTGRGQGFGSTHVLLQIVDPTDGLDDLFLVYLHLNSIAEGVIPGAQVNRGDVIGAVGQEDATYPHLHFEFRKGEPKEDNSVHPLRYLPYANTANFTNVGLDRCNFYRVGDDVMRAIRLRFEAIDRREGDLQGVDVELTGEEGIDPLVLHVDFDDRDSIQSDKGDEKAFRNGIAVEGYQKSNLQGDGLSDLHYGVIVKDIPPEFNFVNLQVADVKHAQPETAEFGLPTLDTDEEPVNRSLGFEGQIFPPRGWELSLLPGNVCRSDKDAALTGSRGLLCQDLESSPGALIRAGLRFALPIARSAVPPMSWRLRADILPTELSMNDGLVIHPLAFMTGDDLVAAACLRKINGGEFVVGVLICTGNGLFKERIDVSQTEIFEDGPVRLELELRRIGTRQTTALVRLNNKLVARVNGDTTSAEPDTACVGILHRHDGLQITLHVDQVVLTEKPRF
jgi:hypothetical protein